MTTLRARVVTMTMTMAAIALLASGCANKEKAAREEFSKDKTCPLDRVTAKARTDLSPWDVSNKGSAKGPPANVANDPARLAMWQKEQADRRATYDSATWIYEVTGCNETLLYRCGIISKGSNHSGQASCTSIK